MDSSHCATNWILVNGPIATQGQQNQFAELRRNRYRFAAMSSFMQFPLPDREDTLDYGAVCEVWCHCFRRPERYMEAALPRALISASDFTNFNHVAPAAVADSPGAVFDFVYAGSAEPWKKEAKNWGLAGKCIPLICRAFGFRALVIGTPDGDFPACDGVAFREKVPWHELLANIHAAKFLFVPNVLDASPRILAEALCLDTPVVVNRHILGGWKYVNRFTGVFFRSETDVLAAVRQCIGRSHAPREWFRSNYGPWLSGARLLQLIRKVDPDISERRHLLPCDGLTRPSEAG